MEIKELHYAAPGTVPYMNVQKRVSWGAIFAGAFVAGAATVLLESLGFALGVAPAPPAGLVARLGGGVVIWWLVTGPLCFYAGGWTAGRLTGIARISDSVIHGVVAWALASLALRAWPGRFAVDTAGIATGGVYFFSWIIMCLELIASAAGAANGTRLLVPSDVVSHEAAEVHRAAGGTRL